MNTVELSQYFTKDQISKITVWFTKDQQKDILKLADDCAKNPPSRKRRPRIRKVDPTHVPRPINCFMAYRCKMQADIRYFCPTANHRGISKMLGKWWKTIDVKEKFSYVSIADKVKVEHASKHPDYVYKPRASAKKGTKASQKKGTKASNFVNNNNNNNNEYNDSEIYQSSPHFTMMGDKEIYEYQSYTSPYDDSFVDRNAASDYYYQSIVNYVPASLNNDRYGSSHGPDMYVDPALLTSGYMDINSAEPIQFDDNNNESAMFAMLSDTPASQMMETPTLDYYQSPLSYPQSGFQQQHDTPHLLDHTIIQSDYTNEYGKLFDTLGGPNDVHHHPSYSSPLQHTQTDDYINFIYGN